MDKYGSNRISNRYKKFEEFLKNANNIEASEVSVSEDGRVGFTNGRHRYAYLRDNGIEAIPVAMSRKSIKNSEKFGYSREQT